MSFQVETQFWRDQTLSGWAGPTWTVDVALGSVIISALATFIALVGSRFWTIVAFAIHQSRVSEAAKDAMHHQHQLIYRNGVSHLSTAWLIFRISCAWKNRISNNVLRTTANMLPPLLCFSLFVVAGIFSARVAAPSYSASRVLIRPNNCGWIDQYAPGIIRENGTAETSASISYTRYMTGLAIRSQSYARTCYGTEASDRTGSCSTYPVQKLPYEVHYNQSCPFAPKRCTLGENTALGLSTAWIDSHHHLGINAAPENRVEIRRSAVCSVLKIDDLVKVYNSLDTPESVYTYYFGPLNNVKQNFTHSMVDTIMNFNIPYLHA